MTFEIKETSEVDIKRVIIYLDNDKRVKYNFHEGKAAEEELSKCFKKNVSIYFSSV